MSHLENEINQQPEVIQRLLKEQAATVQTIAAAIREAQPAFVWIAARGTSDNAARYAQYLFGTHLGLAVGLATPSVHTLYGRQPNLSKALVLGISQSGQSEDVRQVIKDARTQGALTIGITNNPNSPLAQESDFHIDISAGEEKSVAATKTYTTELVAVAMLAAALLDDAEFSSLLDKIPSAVQETLVANADLQAERYRYMERYAVIGRGYNYCTAIEVSLKIKELCYITGEEYSEADFLHGPIAVIQAGFPVIVVAPQGKTLANQIELLEKLQEKRAECLVISNAPECTPFANQLWQIPANVPEWLSPIPAVVPGQMFAMRLAETRGNSIDQPVGLQKVTVTR